MIQPTCWVRSHEVQVEAKSAEDGVGLSCANIILPSMVDVRLLIEVEPEFAEILANVGLTRLRLLATDPQAVFNAPPAGRLDLNLEAGLVQEVLRVRALPAIRIGCQVLPGPSPGSGIVWLREQWVESIARTRPGSVSVHLGMDQVLQGIVLDHLDRPVPKARVEVFRPEPRSIRGELGTTMATTDSGSFVYLGMPGNVEQATVSYAGATTMRQPVRVGDNACILRIDLSDHPRLRVVRGGVPLTEYDCGTRTILFGQQDEPVLTERPDGTCWLPRGEDAPLFLTWREAGRMQEQRVDLAEPRPGAVSLLDLDELPKAPVSTLEFERDAPDLGRYYLHVELTDPVDRLPRGNRGAGIFESRRQRFLGLPPGRYRVRLEERSGKLLGATEIELAGETRRLALSELVGK